MAEMLPKCCVGLPGVLVGQAYLMWCMCFESFSVVSYILKGSLMPQDFKADKQNSELQKRRDSERNKLLYLKGELDTLQTQADVQ